MPEIDITDWMDELPVARHMVVYQRALQAIGADYTISTAGMVDPVEPESIDWDALNEERDLHYRLMCAADTYAELIADGTIIAVGVDDDGHTRYEVQQ
jgi:hypothetical protein